MAGSVGSEIVIAVSEAGGLGSLPCAMLSPEQMRNELGIIRQRTSRPINLNFFCHSPPQADPARESIWRQRLENFYVEFGLDPEAPVPAAARCFALKPRSVHSVVTPSREQRITIRFSRTCSLVGLPLGSSTASSGR